MIAFLSFISKFENKNIKDFKLHGFVTLIHTNHENFKLHEDSIAKLFNEIVDEKTKTEVRKKARREFEYRFHHMLYYKPGGQAIPEMIIGAMKNAFCPEYEAKGHLEALAQPFLERYMQ